MKRTLCMLLSCFFCNVFTFAEEKPVYLEVDPAEVEQVLSNYFMNREFFEEFGCVMDIDATTRNFQQKQLNDSASIHRAILFESNHGKSRRFSAKSDMFTENEESFSTWATIARSGNKYFWGNVQGAFPMEDEKVEQIALALFDPWSIPLCDTFMVQKGGCCKIDFQRELLEANRVVRAEKSDKLVRMEFKMPSASSKFRAQVYFDISAGHMPVLTRYVLPTAEDSFFEEKGVNLYATTKTKWSKIRDGKYCPESCELSRTSVLPDKTAYRITDLKIVFNWHSELCPENGKVDSLVFDISNGASTPEAILETFRTQ